MGFPQTNFGSLVQALYDIKEGIARGLWVDSPLDSKGETPGLGPRSSDIGAISTSSHRFSHRPQTHRQFVDTPYHMIQHDQYILIAPIRPMGPTYLHLPP